MGKALLLLSVVLFVGIVVGCECPPCQYVANDVGLAVDEAGRGLNLDRPSFLHMRDTVPVTYYSPYK